TGRVLGAGAVLVALVVLGAHPGRGQEATGFFQEAVKAECHFPNGTEQVRLVVRNSHNREQYMHYDSDVGRYLADTRLGEDQAKYQNSQPDVLEENRAAVDTYCRHNYGVLTPFIVERKGERVPNTSL
ncbi:HB2L protein, partial [Chionis minor]|nr:HB2L protein [Chionis minor]